MAQIVDVDELLEETTELEAEGEESDLALPPGVIIGTLREMGWDEENVFAG